MIIPKGTAEFNDASAIIRGTIVARTGTFSGTFAAGNVDAVSHVNIKGGAVSTYYGFFTNDARQFIFTIPPQLYARIADITIPISHYGSTYRSPVQVQIYRNGILVASGSPSKKDSIRNLVSVRYIDHQINEYDPVTYTVNISGGSASDGYFLGYAMVGCRKR